MRKTRFLIYLFLITSSLLATNVGKQDLPTIQEAWVDTGYFTWIDSTKTSLCITELGGLQETLPDVCDGEQLTDASEMFTPLFLQSSALKRAPFFNSQNITSFHRMFSRCFSLRSIPLYNTSRGVDFSFMFETCYFLKDIPLFNTSNGRDFSGMFSSCSSLRTVPFFDTSNGSNFIEMFRDCSLLKCVLPLDTSNGKQFGSMFMGCISLTKKPYLPLYKAQDTRFMFSGTQFESYF